MASPEAIGTAACLCGEKVYVCKNSGGFPYFRCPCCGVEVRHHRHTAAAKFIREKVAIFQAEAPPEEAEKPDEKPAAPVVKKAKAPGSMVAAILNL